MSWMTNTLVAGVVLLLSLLVLLSFLAPTVLSADPRPSFPSERTYTSISSSKPLPLPSLLDDLPAKDAVQLSVIVPAYNEEARLPSMLKEALAYLQANYTTYEILVVDDGSRDSTSSAALDFAEEHSKQGGENVRVVTLTKNRGKGGAVRHGMLHARGERMLFVDADGASKFEDLKLLEEEMDRLCGAKGKKSGKDTANGASSNGHSSPGQKRAIVLGSRAHMVRTEAVVKRSKLRNLLMRSFHIYLSVLGIRHIADTQCGFKLFTRPAALAIFPTLHVEGWIFDIEILIIALMLGNVETKEVPIRWNEVEGSKMDLVKDSVKMATDLLVIRVSYAIGRWKVKRV